MKIYAIGDLHLSLKNKFEPGRWDEIKEYKPMDRFGDHWEQHTKKIYQNWQQQIRRGDVVLVPGDLSWAQKLEETDNDFDFISQLPGTKILVKGNHDYWWQSISQLRSKLPDDTYALQYDSMGVNGVSIAGTRGWVCPNQDQFSEHDQKIFRREAMRLKRSLESIENREKKLIVMFHYMPTNEKHETNQFIEILQEYEVDICLYGHLHGQKSHEIRLPQTKWGIEFKLVSADFLDFEPELIYKKM